MAKISIDFGTSNTSAAYVNPSTGRPDAIIFDETGTNKMPSCIHIKQDGSLIVGQQAFELLRDSEKMDSAEHQAVISSTILNLKKKMKPDGVYQCGSKKFTHLDLLSAVFSKVKSEAEMLCGFSDALNEVTLTHPIDFSEANKELMCNAARTVGFSRINLLQEPVAAAIGHIESSRRDCKGILVYDFGGGTFDVAYVKKGLDGNYSAPFKEGLADCGGINVDRFFYDRWNAIARSKLNRNLVSGAIEDLSFLLRCRENKETMSRGYNNGSCCFREIAPPPGFSRLSMSLSSAEFDAMISPLVERTIEKTTSVLNKIKANNYPLDHAILIGGSSRLPLVQKRLSEILPVAPEKVMSTDIAVALGAVFNDSVIGQNVGFRQHCYCIACGKQIRRGYKICIFCGRKNEFYNPKDQLW